MINTQKIETKKFFEDAKKHLSISDERLSTLHKIADTIVDEYDDRKKVNLNFICTHNSRRSQMAQVWAFFAVEYFNLTNIFSYSGGIEVTSFHRNTVKSLQKIGFEFSVVDFSHQNPRYLITFNRSKKSFLAFSKIYNNEENDFPYIAITTCEQAKENCPFIPDAIERFHLPYLDPKIADRTPLQLKQYLEINKKIAGEFFIIFNAVKNLLYEVKKL